VRNNITLDRHFRRSNVMLCNVISQPGVGLGVSFLSKIGADRQGPSQ